jgi:NMD protein affecting ribosome stability and mRNA decay
MCNLGVGIQPNQLNMCLPCLKTKVDITLGISKAVTVFFCRGCGRYLRSPAWVSAALESRELLALCLKKIKGLGKVWAAAATTDPPPITIPRCIHCCECIDPLSSPKPGSCVVNCRRPNTRCVVWNDSR